MKEMIGSLIIMLASIFVTVLTFFTMVYWIK